MPKKTATIERYHCYGTANHHLRVSYKGRTLTWLDPNHPGYSLKFADMVDYGRESIDAAKGHAKRMGFSHVRFTGDWGGGAKPRGGEV